MADDWSAFPEASQAANDPWAAFPPATENAPLRVTVRPPGFGVPPSPERASAALNIPVSYQQAVNEGLSAMGQGIEQIGAGAQGLVSPEASRPSLGPIPISARLKAVGDILGGVLGTAGGAAAYTTAPLTAPVRAFATQPIENISQGYVPREWTEFAASMAAPIPKRLPIPPAVAREVAPSTGGLFDISEGIYKEVAQNPKQLPPAFSRNLKNEAVIDLNERGFHPFTDKATFEALDLLPTERTAQPKEIVSVRKALNRIAKNPAERDAAQVALGKIDQALEETGIPEAGQARGTYHVAMQSQRFNEAVDRAERAKAPFSEAIKSEFRSILNNPAKRRGFPQAVLAEMDAVVNGAPAGNALEGIAGVLGGKGGLTGAFTGALSKGVAPALGYGLNKLAGVISSAQVAKLDEMIRSQALPRSVGAPLQDWSQIAQSFEVAPTPRNLARLTLASRNLANNLVDLGIDVSPDNLLRSLVPVTERQPSEQ